MKEKLALITGASRGIGAAIANTLAQNGYNLILTCRFSEKDLILLKNKLENQYHITCQTAIGDMSDPIFCDALFKNITHLDVLINNAGISYIGLLADMSPKDWHHVIANNLDSVFLTSRLAIPKMLVRKEGSIINISSVWGNAGASMEVAYSASKGGVNAFTRALGKELAPSNIRVNAIACGVIDTYMNRCFSDEERSAITDEIPADRMGTAEEIAQAVLLLIQAPAYLTGQVITVDGGFL